jgi:hypothetical protein
LKTTDSIALVFELQWRRVFGDASGVDWESAEREEIDAWAGHRAAVLRCNVPRAIDVLIHRVSNEGASEDGRSGLFRVLRHTGAIVVRPDFLRRGD